MRFSRCLYGPVLGMLILAWNLHTCTAVCSSRDSLLAASEPDYPPFCIVNEAGEADGFSVELLRAAAAAMNLHISFKVAPWAQIKNDLAEGAVDVLPLVGRSPERERIFDFTFPYHEMHGAVFVRTGTRDITAEADLLHKTVLVMAGDNAHEYVQRKTISTDIVTAPSYREAFSLLAAGTADALIAQRLMGLQLLTSLAISSVEPLDVPLPGFSQDFSFAVREGDKELLALLNEGLSIIIADGTYDRLHKKWWSPIEHYRPGSAFFFSRLLPYIIAALLIAIAVSTLVLRSQVRKRTRVLRQKLRDRKKVEEALRKNDSNFQLFINAIDDIFFLKDSQLRYVISNNANTAFLKKPNSFIIGQTDEQLMPPRIAAVCRQSDMEAITGRKPVTVIETIGDKVYESRKIPVISHGRVVGVAGIIRDVSEQKKAETALKESTERLSLALQGADLGLWDWNVQTGTVIINERWAEMLGYETSSLNIKLQAWKEMIHPEDWEMVNTTLTDHLEGRTPRYETEHRLRNRQGTWQWILDKGKVLERDKNGKPLRAVGTHLDINDRRQAEQKVRSLLAEKEILLKEVHHRIKNNMNSVESLLKLHSRSSTDPAVRAALHDALGRLRSMRVLYDKLSASDNFKEISIRMYLSNLVDEIISIFPERESITVKKNIQDFMIPAEINFPLGIIVNELLTNAMKYAFDSSQTERLISVSAEKKKNHVRITLADNGRGLPHSFDHESPQGLGLQLVQMLADQIDGTVSFSGGKGTVCLLEFDI